MSESVSDNLDGLVMGDGVSEQASESDEHFKARVAATQVKLKKLKKDEKKAKDFDQQLAKILPDLSSFELEVVILLIDHEIPSLTILAVLSISNNEAGKICFMQFDKHIESRADFSGADLPSEAEEKISYWWTFIHGADHLSTTTYFYDLQKNTEFISHFSTQLGQMLRNFLQSQSVTDFNQDKLKTIIQRYQTEIFAEPEQLETESN